MTLRLLPGSAVLRVGTWKATVWVSTLLEGVASFITTSTLKDLTGANETCDTGPQDVEFTTTAFVKKRSPDRPRAETGSNGSTISSSLTGVPSPTSRVYSGGITTGFEFDPSDATGSTAP